MHKCWSISYSSAIENLKRSTKLRAELLNIRRNLWSKFISFSSIRSDVVLISNCENDEMGLQHYIKHFSNHFIMTFHISFFMLYLFSLWGVSSSSIILQRVLSLKFVHLWSWEEQNEWRKKMKFIVFFCFYFLHYQAVKKWILLFSVSEFVSRP